MVGLADRAERVPYSIASAPYEVEQSGQLEFLMKVESSGRWGHLFDRISRDRAKCGNEREAWLVIHTPVLAQLGNERRTLPLRLSLAPSNKHAL